MALPDNYRESKQGAKETCKNCGYFQPRDAEERTEDADGYCNRWNAGVLEHYVCNAWQPKRLVVIRGK